MAHEMFGNIVDPSITVGTRKWYTVPLSILVHAAALMGVVVVPLMATGLLPTPGSVVVFVSTPPPPPPVPVPAPPPTRPSAALPDPTPVNPDAAPPEAPAHITPEPPQRFLAVSADPGGIPRGLPTAGMTTLSAPPPQIPPTVHTGGEIKDPRKIRDVRPIYPTVALAAKVEGMVILEATISKEGNVIDAKVIRSQPLLEQAALDAVRQWKFTPTLLNGVPVDVIMTVTVNFTLR